MLAVVIGVGTMTVWSPPVEAATSITTVDVALGFSTSLVLDSAGNPVISYYDRPTGLLKLARCDDADCAGGGESIVGVDSAGLVGVDPSLVLDAAGNPVISYFDAIDRDLKLARCDDADCSGGGESIVRVDSAGVVGQYTSLVLDAFGYPVVSYFDSTNGDLKLAHCDDADCSGGGESIVTVDSAGAVGRYTSLVLDAFGYPVVSYFDSIDNDLKLAHCDDADCSGGGESIVRVDSAGLVGVDTSLVLDAAGNPVVSYLDFTTGDLKLAHCDDADCSGGGESIVRVDSAGLAGVDPSLVLDAAGNPVVSYFDSIDNDLKLAHCDDADCSGGGESIVRVDSAGLVGGHTSLELDGSGNPVISYVDFTRGAVKLAHCDNADCSTASCDGIAATIVGSPGNDQILGTAGADVVVALDGDDTISGFAGDDVICGGDGDDVLDGGSGDDHVSGDAGVDTVVFFSSPAGVSASLTTNTATGDGTDQLVGDENLVGSPFGDVLVGDHRANTIVGVLGDDTLDGAGGDDVVMGHHGDDVLVGGAGEDALDGDLGFDTVSFAASAARVDADLSTGTAAGEGSDQLFGIEGLTGSQFNDVLTGSAASDALNGGPGDDALNGGSGDDVLRGADGVDAASYSAAAAAISASLAMGTATGDGSDVLVEIETVLGSAFDDVLTGDDHANTLRGGNGDDSMGGRSGDDALDGGPGDDVLRGEDGVDVAIYSASTAAVSANLAIGTATGDGGDELAEIESVVGSRFGDALTGDDAANTLRGGNGDDVVAGAAGNDMVDGGAGVDTVSFAASTAGVTANLGTGKAAGEGTDRLVAIDGVVGSRFNDVLTGNASANTLRGGNGNDVVAGAAGNDMVDGGAGVDTVSFAASTAAVTANLGTGKAAGEGGDQLVGFETVVGSRFADVLIGNAGANALQGRIGNDTLSGRGGNDALDGGAGADTASFAVAVRSVTANLGTGKAVGDGADSLVGVDGLVGSSFDDVLTGNAGANNLRGGSGNDSVQGRAGNDVLDGGAGLDVVSFAAAVRGMLANLTTRAAVGEGADRLVGFETVVGSRFNDLLVGNAGSNTLRGGNGRDRLSGRAGQDVLTGRAGNDDLNGGAGFDRGNGGAGFDTQIRCEVIARIP